LINSKLKNTKIILWKLYYRILYLFEMIID
jgi:hypothetical protein